jgi:proline dehydrogenase
MSSKPGIDFSDTEVAFKNQSDNQLNLNYLIFQAMNQNWLVNIGTFLIKFSLKIGLPIKFIIKRTIFQLFCGGEDIKDCKSTIEKLHNYKVGTILDYSVEGEDDEKSFDATKKEILLTIDKAAASPEKIPFSVFKVTGIGSRDLMTAVQENAELSTEQKAAYQRMVRRFQEICKYAADKGVRIFVDAEETWIQDVIDELTLEEMRKFNKAGEKTIVYNTNQMYRKASYGILERHLQEARKGGFTIGAKLVRGAYMEKESKRAAEKGYEDPINPSKQSTDDEYNKALTLSLNNIDSISVCLGTHNEESCNLAVALMNEKLIAKGDKRVFFAQLLGMSDNISFNLANAGFNVAKYVPYGPIESVMPYLFRRADENSSISGQSSREYLLIKKEKERRKSA